MGTAASRKSAGVYVDAGE